MNLQRNASQQIHADDGRRRHYGHFYNHPDATALDDERGILLIHGNCQAESMRVLFELRYPEIAAVRMVPAHELVASDWPHFDRLMRRARYLVTQPVKDGYRDLPVGTREIVQAYPHLQVVCVPVMRWMGLHPMQVNVRSAAGEAPIVPYHDLRTIVQASGRPRPRLTSALAAAVRDGSTRELQRRIEAHGTVDVLREVTAHGRRTMHVINHPTNDVLDAAVTAAARELGLPERAPVDPGRVLLRSVIAPVEPEAAELAGIAASDDVWQVGGNPVEAAEIVQAHLRWYRENPQALELAQRRHADALTQLRDLGATS